NLLGRGRAGGEGEERDHKERTKYCARQCCFLLTSLVTGKCLPLLPCACAAPRRLFLCRAGFQFLYRLAHLRRELALRRKPQVFLKLVERVFASVRAQQDVA